MTNLKDELEDLKITSKITPITSESYIEFKIKNTFFYKLQNDRILNIHKKLSKRFYSLIETNNSSFAYEKKLSYYDFLFPHVYSDYFVRLDIKSFFYSIKAKYIRYAFKNYFTNIDNTVDLRFEDKSLVIESFINLVMIDLPESSKNKKYKNCKVLPIGFPLSPIISNIVFRPIDIQIEKICLAYNIKYSRYADDMLFSASHKNVKYIKSEEFIKDIEQILTQFDFKLNKLKTMRKDKLISLNGIVIENNEIRLSNKKLDFIKKIIHYNNKLHKTPKDILYKLFKYELPYKCLFITEELEKFYKDQYLNKLAGYRSYLIAIIKFTKSNKILLPNTHSKYIKLLEEIEDIINEL